MKGKKGMATIVVILLGILAVGAIIGGTLGIRALLAIPAVVPAVDYEGEFDDAFLAVKGDFYSDFTEGVDCNITSDVLGATAYSACIYDTTHDNATNGSFYQLDLVIDLDGDVENMEIEGKLQNTGTAQCKDDFIIVEAELWTYEDEDAVLIYSIPIDNEDGEFDGEIGVLLGDEYVLHILLKSKLVLPYLHPADDIMQIKLDLKTDGDVDAARITLEE